MLPLLGLVPLINPHSDRRARQTHEGRGCGQVSQIIEMLEAGKPALLHPASGPRPTRLWITRYAIPGHARARPQMMLGLSSGAADFYRKVVDRANVGLWELDYSAVDLDLLELHAASESALLSAVVDRPDLFHTALDRVRVTAVNERGAEIAGLETAAAAASARPVRFVAGTGDSAQVAQLKALAFRRTSFERTIVVTPEHGREARYRLYWQVIEVEESGLPSRVAVAVVESPQDTAGATPGVDPRRGNPRGGPPTGDLGL